MSGVLTSVVVLVAAQVASADEVATFTGSSGSLSAEANFSLSGTTLTITLTNTSSADCLVPTDVLTAIYFSSPAGVSPVSATVAAGTVYNFASTTNVGGEWAYNGNGLSSSGLGLFGPSDLFGGTNLQGPVAPAGVQFGIVSAGDIAGT